ncbi:MAG: hypothetical protein KTV68_16345 [Acidimicrobiia bacterium]|nr:hypothetical protein [Acidimicrobiia bacterium]MCY4434767.1 hypothetical protein [bacterium]
MPTKKFNSAYTNTNTKLRAKPAKEERAGAAGRVAVLVAQHQHSREVRGPVAT